MAASLDFYFFYGSNHSYLSVMRIGPLTAAASVEVRWRPFNLREILIEQNNTGFVKNEVKMNYFWHDIGRRAARHNIPFAGRRAVCHYCALQSARTGRNCGRTGTHAGRRTPLMNS
jgi:2-hydroxychromene-2-carboxylate isomerase